MFWLGGGACGCCFVMVAVVAIDPFCFEVWFRYLLLDEYVGCFDCAYVGCWWLLDCVVSFGLVTCLLVVF